MEVAQGIVGLGKASPSWDIRGLPEELPERCCRKDKSFEGGVQAQTTACTPFFIRPRSEACYVLHKATGSEMNPTGPNMGLLHWLGRWIQKVLPGDIMSKNGGRSDVGVHEARKG